MGVYKNVISDVVAANNWPESVASAVYRTWQYMDRKDINGGCHAMSSALYVVLSEFGLEPDLYIGICEGPDFQLFDHSWVCLDDKIIDIAISKPLVLKPFHSGVIVADIDVDTGGGPIYAYGVDSPVGFDSDTLRILNTSFVKYMDLFPFERRGGLWTVVGRILGKSVDIDALRKKYADTRRIIKGIVGA